MDQESYIMLTVHASCHHSVFTVLNNSLLTRRFRRFMMLSPYRKKSIHPIKLEKRSVWTVDDIPSHQQSSYSVGRPKRVVKISAHIVCADYNATFKFDRSKLIVAEETELTVSQIPNFYKGAADCIVLSRLIPYLRHLHTQTCISFTGSTMYN